MQSELNVHDMPLPSALPASASWRLPTIPIASSATKVDTNNNAKIFCMSPSC
jgi:hypothetical protein